MQLWEQYTSEVVWRIPKSSLQRIGSVGRYFMRFSAVPCDDSGNVPKAITVAFYACVKQHTRSHRLSARTTDFHSVKRSSTLLETTKTLKRMLWYGCYEIGVAQEAAYK